MKTTESIIQSLENAPNIILPLVREVKTEFLKCRPSPQKWSAHEHACHLADVHQLFLTRLDLMLENENPTIQPYFPDKDDADDKLLKVDLDEALLRFAKDREILVQKLKNLSPEDWQRTANHQEYSHYTIFIMFRHLALHDFLHTYRIEELLLKKDWN